MFDPEFENDYPEPEDEAEFEPSEDADEEFPEEPLDEPADEPAEGPDPESPCEPAPETAYTPSYEPAPEASPDWTMQAPRVSTKKEFLKLEENRRLRKSLTTSAIICYICGGITLLVALITGSWFGLIDVAILIGLGLAIHLSQSKVCAIILAVYAALNTIIGLINNGRFSGWIILLAGVYAIIATFQLDKAWKEYRA